MTRLKRWTEAVLDLVYPRFCIECGGEPDHAYNGLLCNECAKLVRIIERPWCNRCGLPMDADQNIPSNLLVCDNCRNQPPPYRYARAAIWYDPENPARDWILKFKHAGRIELASNFAEWMSLTFSQFLQPEDYQIIVPVPLHPSRLRKRGYNQAAILAELLGKRFDIPTKCVLHRTRKTPPQKGALSERLHNLRGAFQCSKSADFTNQGLLLVDDVMTTGTTAAQCTQALMNCNASVVDILTLARVPRTSE